MSTRASPPTPSTTKTLFFLWLPDYPDSDVGRRRLEATPRHIKQMLAFTISKQGHVNYGGVTTLEPTAVNARQAAVRHIIDGSIVVLEAQNIEAVWNLIKADAFYTENVWDKDRIVVKPFLQIFPLSSLPVNQTTARL